jgi:hypothetical protein
MHNKGFVASVVDVSTTGSHKNPGSRSGMASNIQL